MAEDGYGSSMIYNVSTDKNKTTTLHGCIGQGSEGLGRLGEVRLG